MTQKEYILFTDGEAWVDYHGNLYECIGKDGDKWVLSDVNDGYTIRASFEGFSECMKMAIRNAKEWCINE